jgi:hypothetical protein
MFYTTHPYMTIGDATYLILYGVTMGALAFLMARMYEYIQIRIEDARYKLP